MTRLPTGHPEGFIEAFANIYRDFADAIAGGEGDASSSPISREGVRGMTFVETRRGRQRRDDAGWVARIKERGDEDAQGHRPSSWPSSSAASRRSTSLETMAKWVSDLGYVGVPDADGRRTDSFFDLARAAESQAYCDDIAGTAGEPRAADHRTVDAPAGAAAWPSTRPTDELFDGFAPPELRGKPKRAPGLGRGRR